MLTSQHKPRAFDITHANFDAPGISPVAEIWHREGLRLARQQDAVVTAIIHDIDPEFELRQHGGRLEGYHVVMPGGGPMHTEYHLDGKLLVRFFPVETSCDDGHILHITQRYAIIGGGSPALKAALAKV